MTSDDLAALLPLIIVSATSVIVLLAIALRRNHRAVFALTIAGEFAALGALGIVAITAIAAGRAPVKIGSLLVIDGHSLLFTGLVLAASLAVAALAYTYLARRSEQKEEFYVLLLLATVGSMVLVSSNHFVPFFVGLEILSVSLYTMIAYLGNGRHGIEAGLKYLILAGTSTAFLAFGMALVYATLGSMEFRPPAAPTGGPPPALAFAGLALIFAGVGFKLALVPFHMWTPDVYQGAPAPVAAFIATISKGAVFAVILRFLIQTGPHTDPSIPIVLTVLSLASMTAGNFLALMQKNLKRILAYSSIAHLGYLLMTLLTARELGIAASSFYLMAYFISVLAAFGVITVYSSDGKEDKEDLDDYRGLFWRRPGLALVLSAALFSLAGIPLTAGFIGKFYVLAAGIGAAQWLLVVGLAITSAVGLFYYLRVIVALYTTSPEPQEKTLRVSWTGSAALIGLFALLIWFGIAPAGILRLIDAAVF